MDIEDDRAAIGDLPDEILMKIFSHLSQDDLHSRVFFVCRRWGRVAHDPTLWETTRVDINKMGEERALSLVQTMAPHIRNLKLVSWSRITCDAILEAVTDIVSLKMMGVTVQKIKSLAGLISRSEHLKDVHIRRCWFLRFEKNLVDIFVYCAHLERFTLSNSSVYYLPDRSLQPSWRNLQSVSLNHDGQPGELELGLFASCSMEHMRHLSISLNRYTSFDLVAKNLKNLETLDLIRSRISDTELVECIGRLLHLRHLSFHLSGEHPTANAIKTFFSLSHIHLQVETLKLSGVTHLDDSCLDVIANCVSLQEVVLTRCDEITQSGLNLLKRHVPKVTASQCQGIPCVDQHSSVRHGQEFYV